MGHLALSSEFTKCVLQAAAEWGLGFCCCRGDLCPWPVPFSHLACLVVPVRGREQRRAGVRPPQHHIHKPSRDLVFSVSKSVLSCSKVPVPSLATGQLEIAGSFPCSGHRQPVYGYLGGSTDGKGVSFRPLWLQVAGTQCRLA